MMMLNVPATLGLIVLAEPIIRLIFERGSFTAADTAATAAALRWYAVGLVGYSVVRIVSPTFYALGRSRVPVTVSVDLGADQRRAEPGARALHGLPRARARARRWPRSSTPPRSSCSCAVRLAASRDGG